MVESYLSIVWFKEEEEEDDDMEGSSGSDDDQHVGKKKNRYSPFHYNYFAFYKLHFPTCT